MGKDYLLLLLGTKMGMQKLQTAVEWSVQTHSERHPQQLTDHLGLHFQNDQHQTDHSTSLSWKGVQWELLGSFCSFGYHPNPKGRHLQGVVDLVALVAFCYALVAHEVCQCLCYCADLRGIRVHHRIAHFLHAPGLHGLQSWGANCFFPIFDLSGQILKLANSSFGLLVVHREESKAFSQAT